jgi:hypothetical protein
MLAKLEASVTIGSFPSFWDVDHTNIPPKQGEKILDGIRDLQEFIMGAYVKIAKTDGAKKDDIVAEIVGRLKFGRVTDGPKK